MILLVVPSPSVLNQVPWCFHEWPHPAAYCSLGTAKRDSAVEPLSSEGLLLGLGLNVPWSGPLLSTQLDWAPRRRSPLQSQTRLSTQCPGSACFLSLVTMPVIKQTKYGSDYKLLSPCCTEERAPMSLCSLHLCFILFTFVGISVLLSRSAHSWGCFLEHLHTGCTEHLSLFSISFWELASPGQSSIQDTLFNSWSRLLDGMGMTSEHVKRAFETVICHIKPDGPEIIRRKHPLARITACLLRSCLTCRTQ